VASLETQHDNFLEKNNKHKEIFRSETMNQAEVAKLKRERLRVLQHVRAEARNIRGGVAKRRKEAFVRLAIRDLTHEVARRAVHNDMVGIIGDMNRVTTIFIRLDQLIPHIASGDLGMKSIYLSHTRTTHTHTHTHNNNDNRYRTTSIFNITQMSATSWWCGETIRSG